MKDYKFNLEIFCNPIIIIRNISMESWNLIWLIFRIKKAYQCLKTLVPSLIHQTNLQHQMLPWNHQLNPPSSAVQKQTHLHFVEVVEIVAPWGIQFHYVFWLKEKLQWTYHPTDNKRWIIKTGIFCNLKKWSRNMGKYLRFPWNVYHNKWPRMSFWICSGMKINKFNPQDLQLC